MTVRLMIFVVIAIFYHREKMTRTSRVQHKQKRARINTALWDFGSFTVSGQRVVNYSIKIVSILRPLDYVFASPTENVKSRLVPTCLDDSFQKRDTLN